MEQTSSADSESLWIQQIANGSREAFENLYRAYLARLFRYLFSMIGDCLAAEELADDVMVSAWKAAAKFRGEAKVSTWLFGIARHKALNHLRQKQPATVAVESASQMVAPDEDPGESMQRQDVALGVRRALQELSPEHREVIELTFYQGLSYQEIAVIMQSPINTVKTRMFYAKKRLQEALEKNGIVGEAP